MKYFQIRNQAFAPCLTAIAVMFLAVPAGAGGYLNIDAGVPYKWGGTVTMRFDQGLLGSLTNAQADALANAALQKWSNAQIPNCSLVLQQDPVTPELAQDHAFNNGSDADSPTYNDAAPDGISPMIYDQFGFLIDAKLGAGQSNGVIGFAGPRWLNSNNEIIEGRAVINGKFIDGAAGPADISQSQMEGVVAHEIGHMLNLDHAQGGRAFSLKSTQATPDLTGFPTMFPLVHSDIADLELDDKSWISDLYPTAAHTADCTHITGVIRDNGGAALSGVNVVARSATNARDIITCVSGFLDTASGEYDIPSLPAGSQWVLDVEQIEPGFTGGSRVGPIQPPLELPGPPEYLTNPSMESNSDSLLETTTFLTGAGGTSLTGIDLRLNASSASTNQTEVDPGASLSVPVSISGLNVGGAHVISGTLDGAESGNVTLGGDDIEDYYVYSPPVGVEIQRVTLTPNAAQDGNVWIISYDQANGQIFAPAIGAKVGNGVVEQTYPFIDTSLTGSGTGAGKVYIGVSTPASSGTFPYTLKIETAVSDKDALVVNKPASLDPTPGSITISGRGFSNVGGAPAVVFSDPEIVVDSVSYISPTQLNVSVTRGAGFVPGGLVDIAVTNKPGALSYAGQTYNVTAVPVTLSDWSLE